MKYYLLALATLVAVCVGCQSAGRDSQAMRGGPLGPGDDVLVARGNHGQAYGHGHHRPYVAPPAEFMVRPGPMVDGPGPGVLNAIGMGGGYPGCGINGGTTQVKFIEPVDMAVGWQMEGGFAEAQISTPGRYNFHQGASYRLKLTNIPGREALVLYPTLQVYPSHPQTEAYLAHNTVPVQITEEDLDQVQANNFVTKVIYLPSPEHQELAVANIEQLVSTRLDPGLDPVAEADRRGTILLVLRIGNMDMETGDGAVLGGGIHQAGHIQTVSGLEGQYAAPMPIGGIGASGHSIPPAMMVSGPVYPGQPAAMQPWGQPITGTPIGLAGPPHLPYGAPAGLRSHTVRNLSKNHIPQPTRDLLIDVKQNPPINIPEPVRHIEYEERHPVFVNP